MVKIFADGDTDLLDLKDKDDARGVSCFGESLRTVVPLEGLDCRSSLLSWEGERRGVDALLPW